ncbi:hypothetical protein [Streptomyces sp. NPDC055709]
MVAVPVREDDPADGRRIGTETANRPLDTRGRVDVPGIDQGEFRAVAPEIRLADPETRHVQPGQYLDDIHAADVRSRARPPHGSPL